MDSGEEQQDWRSIIRAELQNRSEFDQAVIKAMTGLEDGAAQDHDELLRTFYRQGLTARHLHRLSIEMAKLLHPERFVDRQPPDYAEPASKSDRDRFQMLDQFAVSLATEVTGLPAKFVSSGWQDQMWGPKGFRFNIEVEDSGGQVPVNVEVDPDFTANVSVVDITGGNTLHVFGLGFDEETNAFQVVEGPLVIRPGSHVRLSSESVDDPDIDKE